MAEGKVNQEQQLQRHDLEIQALQLNLKNGFERIDHSIDLIPRNLKQEMALMWAERDEQKRKEHAEIRMWFIGLVISVIVGAFVLIAAVGAFFLHERDTVREDHQLITKTVSTVAMADHKSDQALNEAKNMNTKLDLVIFYHKKEHNE